MKKALLISLALSISLVMVACGGNDTPSSSEAPPSSSTEQPNSQAESNPVEDNKAEEQKNTATIYTVFSLGGTDGSEVNMSAHEMTYENELTAEMIADELTDLTGYDFAIDVIAADGESMHIQWSKNSTLVTVGDGNTTPKEGYLILEIEGIRWFMLDSLYESISENLGITELYYSTEGNVDSKFGDTIVTAAFSANQAGMYYMGSNFYKNHAGNVGDEDDDYFAMTVGTWYLNGEHDNDYIDMFEDGAFIYYSDGKAYAEGIMTYEVVEADYMVYYHLYAESTADSSVFNRSFYHIDDNIIQFDTLGEFIRAVG